MISPCGSVTTETSTGHLYNPFGFSSRHLGSTDEARAFLQGDLVW